MDLDPEAQVFSEIWGWRIRVGHLLSADFTPVSFQYMWKKMNTKQGGSLSLGAVYQSELKNIEWMDNHKTSFIEHFREAMDNIDNINSHKLSIRLNLDMFNSDSRKDAFTFGRVTGSFICFPYIIML